jgi:hypothetical protein
MPRELGPQVLDRELLRLARRSSPASDLDLRTRILFACQSTSGHSARAISLRRSPVPKPIAYGIAMSFGSAARSSRASGTCATRTANPLCRFDVKWVQGAHGLLGGPVASWIAERSEGAAPPLGASPSLVGRFLQASQAVTPPTLETG